MPTPPFRAWTAWRQRETLDERHLCGVFLLGKFDGAPPSTVDPLASEVIFIGKAEGSFEKRWKDFEHSAFHAKPGHSAGWTFASKYLKLTPKQAPVRLYVAPLPLAGKDIPRSQPIKRQLLLDYQGRHGAWPTCNTNGR
jgi:hypothetical protein